MPQYVRDHVTGKWVVSTGEQAQPSDEPTKATEAPAKAAAKTQPLHRSLKEEIKAELREELLADFVQLRKRIEQLERQLVSQSKDGAQQDAAEEKADAEASAEQREGEAQQEHDDQEPITEAQAFEAIGGRTEIRMHRLRRGLDDRAAQLEGEEQRDRAIVHVLEASSHETQGAHARAEPALKRARGAVFRIVLSLSLAFLALVNRP